MNAFAAIDAGTRSEAQLLRAAHPVIATVVDRVMPRAGVRRLPGLGVLVADPASVRRILSDGDHFVKSGPGSSGALWTPVLGERVLLNMDGAAHLDLRRSLADLFSPRTVTQVGDLATRPLVDAARTRLEAGEQVDVVDLARRVAAATISVVVGLDPLRHMQDVLAANDAIERLVTWRTREFNKAQIAAARRHLAIVQDAAEATHARGGADTVMGRLAADGTSVAEARSLAAALLLTGTGTVSSALPRIVGQLADAHLLRPTSASSPRGALDVDAVVAEGLRMTTPSLVTLRRCVRETTVGGTRLRAGDRLVVLLWWATRLEGGFRPGRTVPTDLRHLWFGAGAHFCLGAPLAVAELRAMTGLVMDVAAERGLSVVRRRPARGVLVPRYAELVVRAG